MITPLTPAQKRVYDFFRKFYKENGVLPSYQIASDYLGISKPAVFKHVKILQARGYISKDPTGNVYFDNNQVRILGYISCGGGIDLIEDEIDTIDVPRKMLNPYSKYYALIAKGNSMIKANIQNGDILIIKQQSDIMSGEIGVVVKDDGLVTLKRVYKRSSDILLQPENDDFSPILIKNCEIRGKLVGVIRDFE